MLYGPLAQRSGKKFWWADQDKSGHWVIGIPTPLKGDR
jgi:hypothetical protein